MARVHQPDQATFKAVLPEDMDFPPVARQFKDALAKAEAVLFVTPEYNRSIPGGLKNAIDWASVANAALVDAKDRKRCGECKPQPSEADTPGSGTSIALGTALDAVPEALVLGVALRAGEPDCHW